MDDLIKALQIMRKYGNPYSPTHCEHDEMTFNIDSSVITAEDKEELEQLGVYDTGEMMHSFRYGSC